RQKYGHGVGPHLERSPCEKRVPSNARGDQAIVDFRHITPRERRTRQNRSGCAQSRKKTQKEYAAAQTSPQRQDNEIQRRVLLENNRLPEGVRCTVRGAVECIRLVLPDVEQA